MENLKNKKTILCAIIGIIIVIGIICICTLKLNYTLMYSNNTRINIYIGKAYNMNDIKQIAEEVFQNKEIIYQKVENFNDTVSITVKETSEEQINTLKEKILEKYELEDIEIESVSVGNYRGRDIVKPYIIPTLISVGLIGIYMAVRYRKLGIAKVVLSFIIAIVISQALLLSIIAIYRIPIGIYTMPISMLVYIISIIYDVVKNNKKLDEIKVKE